MNLQLTLLGNFALSRDGELIALKNKKAQALLVYLALTGKPQLREKLATLLWGDRFDDQARRSLRQAVFALRKAVGPDVVVGVDELGLAGNGIIIDALSLNGDKPLLPDFRIGEDMFDIWLARERTRFNAQMINRHILAAEEERANQNDDTALALYQKAFELDPLGEDTLRRIMELLMSFDRRAEGLAIFENFRNHLKTELDAEPSRETITLAARLRSETSESENSSKLSFAEITADPQVVILPFENLGGGDMAAVVASEFAREVEVIYSAQRVITAAPTEMEIDPVTHKVDDLKTARNFGAPFVLTGTVSQIGDTVRLSVRYLSVKDSSTKWVHRETFSADSAFERMGQLARTATYKLVILTIELESTDQLLDKLRQNTTNRITFLKLWKTLFWRAAIVSQTRAYLAGFRKMTEIALKFEPRELEILLASSFFRFHQTHLGDGKDKVAGYHEARKFLDEAYSRDPNSPNVLMQQIIQSIWIGDHNLVERNYSTLVNNGVGVAALEGVHGTSLVFQNRNDEAITKLTLALTNESGTINLFYRFSFLGLAYFNIGRIEEALEKAERALEVGREFFMGHLVKIAALERLGRHNDAAMALDDMRRDYRDPTVSEFDFLPFTQEEPKQKFLDTLRDAGMPE